MLKQRILTAVVLMAVLLAVLWAPGPWPFALFTLATVGAAGWEWGRLNGLAGAGAVAVGAATVALAFGLAAATGPGLSLPVQPPVAFWWLALAGWVAGGAWAIRQGPSGWGRQPAALRRATGVLLLAVAWLAFNRAHAFGLNFLLSVGALVWAADIAAYFGGRAFGRRKLAPSISPGKSWAGVWSGMAGVLVLGAAWWGVVDRHVAVDGPSLYTRLAERHGAAVAAVALVFLAAMSVVGDLVESLVKRSAGAKDSSTLLPGHGGVLDRIDALLPVFPLALALVASAAP